MPNKRFRPGAPAPAAAGQAPDGVNPRRRSGRMVDDPIALGLRKLWQDIESEPIPAELLDLLDAIDAAHTGVAPALPDDKVGDGTPP